MNDAQLKDIALNFQAGINNELLKENEWLKRKIATMQTESCEDAISREETFQAINCWIGSGEYRFINATYYLAKRIKDLPPVQTAQNAGWVPCRNRLPDDMGVYLVCFDDGYIASVEYGMDGDRMDWLLWQESGEVTAWMPLPEPYRKEGE